MDKLYQMTVDSDPLVVMNAIEAINEVMADDGGLQVTKPLVVELLNRINNFNEWGQASILEIISKYKPENEEEMFNIMNLLNDRFRHSNSAVVLGTVKVFLHLTKDNKELTNRVFACV